MTDGDKSVPWCIHRLEFMVGDERMQTLDSLGTWVRAVPEPYHASFRERLTAAWWVLTRRAVATQWPEPGDLERALGTYRVRKPAA